MRKDSLKSYIHYRIERSRETFNDSEILADKKRWNSCINRLYYACFYMVFALLVKERIQTKTHSGVHTMFFKHFIVTQRISKDFGQLYADLFDWRNEGDYGDFIDFDESVVLPTLEKVDVFLAELEKIIVAQDQLE
ncbi:HEPN domain-containing protein [Marinoscillum sp.]|uniref:HEPN domain-containing protein n=1 Tax=Marinoscillum sp. TaxID=2024838 RepID=UPI003BACC35E